MNKIWESFENLDELMYVADAGTHELIYMNKKARQNYGIRSVEEIAAKKCHVELVSDVSSEEQKEGMLDNYRNLELLVNDGIRLALQTTSPDEAIDIILEYIGKALSADRVYIFEKDDKDFDNNTYEWCAKDVEPEKEMLQNLEPGVCGGWYEMFQKNKDIVITDIDKIKEEDSDMYEILSRQDIKSLVVVPLSTDMKITGFYGVDNPPEKYIEHAHNILQIAGYFISSCIRRRNLIKQLEDMSYKDALTKLGNRFAVEKFIKDIDVTRCIGAVYCDITGLKKVNDTKGHEAGDRLILRACESLEKVFDNYGIFRIGGDEFLILCPGIKEDELYKRVDILKNDAQQNDALMAVGAVWRTNFEDGLDKFLTESEQNMYFDKSEYYRTSGQERRK